MKHILFLVLITFSISVSLNANSYRWGKVPDAEKQLKQTSLDTNASAVVLFDIGSLRFNYGSKIYFQHHKRIKILTKEGLSYADVQIPYYKRKDLESISTIKAETINIDSITGKPVVQKLDSKDFYTLDINDRWGAIRFSFPSVKVGSIIEYSYTMVSQNYLSLQNWDFQCELPTLHSEFSAQVQEGLDVQILYQGPLLRHLYETKSTNFWELDNLQPVAPEPYGPDTKDYVENITFQLKGYYKDDPLKGVEYVNILDTWDKLAIDYRETVNVSSFSSSKSFVDPILAEIIKEKDSDAEKVRKIYYYVQSHFRWNKYLRIYPTESSRQILQNGEGNSADINLFLSLMLRSAGFAADPVLISTKSNGASTKVYPLLSQFDKLIVVVNLYGKNYFMDATGSDYPYSIIPAEDLNNQGFRIGSSTADWISISANGASKLDCYYSVDLTNLANAKLTAMYNFSQYAAVGLRAALKNAPDKETYIKKYIALLNQDFNLDSVSIKNLDDMDMPLSIRCYFSGGDYSGANGLLLRTLGQSKFDKNPFIAKQRTLPIDFDYPIDETFTTVFNLPEGYVVDGLPLDQGYQLLSKKGIARLTSNSIGNTVTIRRTMSLTTSLFPPADYSYIVKYFDLVSQFKGATVVVKKN
ncbi:MAG TPA: DUF3857 domain-containing protein [Williamwhitmania sp.]|nr:DUF3857 domain-containing protein [Williamwhitmania sp.]